MPQDLKLPDKLTDNPLVDAAQKKLGPLPAWQWGALAGGAAIALRLILPPSGSGSFFRRGVKGSTSDVPSVGASGIDRRPVAPFGGLDPGLGTQPAFIPGQDIMPGFTIPNPFLSVTTPGGVSISGEGLSAEDVTTILRGIAPGNTARVNVPNPKPSPAQGGIASVPTGQTPAPAARAPVAPASAPRTAFPRSTPPARSGRRTPAPPPAPAPAPAPVRRTTSPPVASRPITAGRLGRTRPKTTPKPKPRTSARRPTRARRPVSRRRITAGRLGRTRTTRRSSGNRRNLRI